MKTRPSTGINYKGKRYRYYSTETFKGDASHEAKQLRKRGKSVIVRVYQGKYEKKYAIYVR